MLKHRYAYVLLIFAVLCLSIGAAFAAEDASDGLADSNSFEGDDIQSIDDEVYLQDSEDSILTDDEDDEEEDDGEGPGWGDLNLVLDNDESEITLEDDYGFNHWDLEDDEIEEARSGILINRDLTIDGDGHRLDGRGFARAFNIASESHVTLKNIIFESCFADEGGAIYNSGTLTIENCQFRYCGNNWEENCKTSNGGAIYNNGDLNVTDSIFYQNEARKGGAIYNNGDLNVTLSAFLDNRVVYNGDGGDDGGDDEVSYGIYVNDEEIITDSGNEDYDEDAIVVKVILPPETYGSFTAFVNDEELFDIESESHSDYDEEGNVICSVYLKDLNLAYLSDEAEVEFSFFVDGEKLEGFTKFAIVHLTDSTIQFSYGDDEVDDTGDGGDEDEEGDREEDASNGRDVYIASGTAIISNSYMSSYGWDDKYVVYVEDGVEEGNVVLDDNYWPGGIFKMEYDEEADEEFEVLAVSNTDISNYLELILKVDSEDDPLIPGKEYEFYAYFVSNGTDEKFEGLPKSNFVFYVENMDGHTEEFEDCVVPVENGQTSFTIGDGQYGMHCVVSIGDDLRLFSEAEVFQFGQTCKNWQDLSEEIGDNAEVELDGTYRFNWGDEEPLIIELNTDGQIINGQFNTLNGVNDVSAFHITASNVVIKNLNFNKCRGAIILDGGSVTLINCTFDNCEARWDDEEQCDLIGSALRINSGTANLIDCIIKNSRFCAIYNGGTLNVSNSIFLNPGEGFEGINVYISEDAQNTIINNSCLFVFDNWENKFNVFFENPEDAEYDLNNNFWGFEKPGEDNACVNADVDSYIYAKIEPSIPDFMGIKTTFTLKFFNPNGELLTDFFNGEVQFIESHNYMNYEEGYEPLGEPIPVTDGTATYTYTPTNDDIQFIGAQIIYDGKVVGLSTKCERSANDFTALIELINNLPDNGVLNLSNDYIYGGRNSRDREIREFYIDKNIIINGNGFHINMYSDKWQNYEVDCMGFVIEKGCTVVINDFNIDIFNPITDKGSAFYNKGNLTLNNCNVSGEIYVLEEGEDLVIYGGAIYNDEGAVMTINSSRIEGGAGGRDYYPDDLTAYGGVIYNKGSLTITESEIEGHEYGNEDHSNCPSFGGGIYNEGDLNITYSILSHNSAKNGTDIYHNGTSLYVSNSILASCEQDITRRHLFDFSASYGEYNLYAEKTENYVLDNIWWGINIPDEYTTNLVLDNYVIFSLTALDDIVEGVENTFIVEFINNGTKEGVLPCPHGKIMYFFIEKYNGKSIYVGNQSLDENGRCSISYTPESSDYLISSGLNAQFNMYGQFDISDIRMELLLGLGGFTFKDLHDQIETADGYLELTEDYRFESDKDDLYTEGVLIENKNIVIEGNGHTINCVGLSGPFNITDSNVTIRNVHLVNCKYPFHINGNTNLTLINCDNFGVVLDGGYELHIGSGAHADIYRCFLEYIANYGSVNINSSRISHLDGFDGSNTIVHNSVFRAYGDTTFVSMEENAYYDLNDNFWDEDNPKTRIEGADFDSWIDVQFLTSYAPNVDVLNYFTVRFVYNGTDEVNTNINLPISFQKQFRDEIDGHPHTKLITHMNVTDGVARLEYRPDINTSNIIMVWGEIEDTEAFFFDEFYYFEIIPNETRINIDQDDETIYINVTSNDHLVDDGILDVAIYIISGDDNNRNGRDEKLGMAIENIVADDEDPSSLGYFITREISELPGYILELSKSEIAQTLGLDSFGGCKFIIIVSFHSNTKNYADSEASEEFYNDTKFYTIITTIDNHIGNKAILNVAVISNNQTVSSGQIKLVKDGEVIDQKSLSESAVSFTLSNMEPGPYDREHGNYAIVFEDESGKETNHTINFVVTAPTTVTTIISNDVGSVEITINMGSATQGIIDLFKNGVPIRHAELNGRNSVLVALDMIAGALEDDNYMIKFIPLDYKQATAKNTTFDLSNSQDDIAGIIIVSDLPSDAAGNFIIGLDDGTNITVNPSEGIPPLDLSPGDHKLKLSYDGDDYYAFDLDLDYTVKESVASGISLNTVVGSHILKVSGVPSDLGEKLLLTIDGITYEGTASGFDIPSFSSSGIVAATISYPGDAKYSSFSKKANINVAKISTNIVPKSVTFYANPNFGYLAFNILDSSGKGLAKTVTVVFNGKTYTVKTNANGYGSIKLSAAAAKTYTASLKFAGDSVYAGSSSSVQVKVKKNKVKITAKTKKVKKSAKKLKVKYLFKTATGKKLALKGLTVYLKINKKTVKAKTNKKGIATFKIKLPKKKKTYKAKVIFKGNKANLKKTLSTKLKVK